MSAKLGRPLVGDKKKLTAVSISLKDIEIVKKLGFGNLSRGIRIVIGESKDLIPSISLYEKHL